MLTADCYPWFLVSPSEGGGNVSCFTMEAFLLLEGKKTMWLLDSICRFPLFLIASLHSSSDNAFSTIAASLLVNPISSETPSLIGIWSLSLFA